MKKILSLCLICFLVFAVLLAGCAKEENQAAETAQETEPSAEPEEVDPVAGAKISFWAYNANDNNDSVLESIVSAFEQVYDAEVDLVVTPRGEGGFDTKLTTAIAVGEEPDVSYLDQPQVAEYATDGILLALDPYMDGPDGINKDEFFQGALDTNLLDGTYYGLPLSHTCIAMFYNKDLVPEPPATWSEMLAIAEQVYVPGEIAAFERPWDGGGGAWMFPAYIGTAGGQMVNEDNTEVLFESPEGVEALEFFYQDLMQYSDAEVYQSADAFGNGLVAMRVSGSWDVEGYVNNFPDLNFGVALIPKKEGAEYCSNMGGENLVAYNSTEYPEAAFQLMKWITNEENSIPVAKLITGNFPVRTSALEDPYYSENEYMQMFLEQARYAQPRPRIISWLKINDEVLGAAINEFIAGEKSAEQALSDAAERANQIIAEDLAR